MQSLLRSHQPDGHHLTTQDHLGHTNAMFVPFIFTFYVSCSGAYNFVIPTNAVIPRMLLYRPCFYTDNVVIPIFKRYHSALSLLFKRCVSKSKTSLVDPLHEYNQYWTYQFYFCHMALHCKPLLYGNKQKKTVSMVWLFPIEAKRNWSNNFLSNTFYRNPLCYIYGVNDSGATNEHYCQQPPSRYRTAARL